MGQIILLFVLKIIMLVAATAQTIGFVGLFAFDALQPYKWRLLIGGTIAISVTILLEYFLVRRMARETA